MKEFLLIFRREHIASEPALSPEQLQAMMKPWQDWIGNIAAQNKLANSGNRLEADGRVLKTGNIVTDGPYVEIKEAIGGYIIVKANSLEEATELAKGCPILMVGGNVEIRTIVSMN
ncbi:YciI family protein [Limnovirga soli]|uniref:Transcription initiation protein n=1 Tax=Limnovirga soli TaxID=2656915 RepID=A0A8J8FFT8_9BACT|nr:YciI family protein [Limnovirga soli]NNV55111.1 transcription initiation protein [Limnovirga soli]